MDFITLVFAAFLLFLSHTHSHLLPIVGNSSEIQTYIIHVQKHNGTKFLRFSDRRNWYMSFLPNTTLDSGEPRMLYAYRHVISGFAARLTRKEVEDIEAMDGFVLAYPEREHVAQTTYTPKFLGLSGQDGLWNPSYRGNGIIIGVLDTGIKATHPSFDDSQMPPAPPAPKWNVVCQQRSIHCNKKILTARGIRFGRYKAPNDNNGHGTHVASTAAGEFVQNAEVLGMAKGTASGMAPRAHLAIYKVLFNNQQGEATGTTTDILAGIEQAISDGVDILSMSLGSVNITFHENPVNIGSFAAMKKGIVPCAAATNEGPFKSTITNDAPWVLTVGASSVDRRIRATVRLGNGSELHGESAYQPDWFDSTQMLPIAYPGASNIGEDLACSNLDPSAVQGKIVLCWVGLITTGKNITNAGGAAMIILNNWPSGNTTSAEPHVIPASHITYDDAQTLLSYYKTTPNPTATIVFQGTQFGTRPAPAIASFSSRGPSLKNGGILKPDVVAPGENILAAWPFEVGPNPVGKRDTFNFLSGTSMATPHVSGIVALLKNTHPSWSPAMIKSALMTTAYIIDLDGEILNDEYSGSWASIYAEGMGHVDPRAANDPGLVYDLHYYDYVHYLCGAGFSDAEVGAILQTTVQCNTVKSIPPEQLNYPSISLTLGSNSPTKVVNRTLTNVVDGSEEYQMDFIGLSGVSVDVSPTTLQFSSLGDTQTYNITFSINGIPPKAGQYTVGRIKWVSGKHVVRSVIIVTFT